VQRVGQLQRFSVTLASPRSRGTGWTGVLRPAVCGTVLSRQRNGSEQAHVLGESHCGLALPSRSKLDHTAEGAQTAGRLHRLLKAAPHPPPQNPDRIHRWWWSCGHAASPAPPPPARSSAVRQMPLRTRWLPPSRLGNTCRRTGFAPPPCGHRPGIQASSLWRFLAAEKQQPTRALELLRQREPAAGPTPRSPTLRAVGHGRRGVHQPCWPGGPKARPVTPLHGSGIHIHAQHQRRPTGPSSATTRSAHHPPRTVPASAATPRPTRGRPSDIQPVRLRVGIARWRANNQVRQGLLQGLSRPKRLENLRRAQAGRRGSLARAEEAGEGRQTCSGKHQARPGSGKIYQGRSRVSEPAANSRYHSGWRC